MTPKLKHLASASALALLLPVSAQAAPIISQHFLFTENRNATAVTPAGHTFLLGSTSITPTPGFTVTSVTGTHVPAGSGPDYTLGFVPAPLFPNQYAVRTAYAGQIGQCDIAATDGSGTSMLRTHVLDDVRLIPLVTGLTVSGPGLAPTLTWDPVNTSLFPSGCAGGPTLGCDFFNYQIEVRLITGTPGNPTPLAFASVSMPTTGPTTFTLAPGILAPGLDYLLGVRLNHLEFEQPAPGGPLVAFLENRGTMMVAHSTAPTPGTALLLSLGLGGVVALRATRRRKNAR